MNSTSDLLTLNLLMTKGRQGMRVERNKTLRVLTIGNSFSVDAMEFLYHIAKDVGYEIITLGNLYIGGCSLQRHWQNALNEIPDYNYYKNTEGAWTCAPQRTLFQGLTDEAWDYIVMQQASPVSGIASSYEPFLEDLIAYVQRFKQNRFAKLVWHMTWAYQQDYDHGKFDAYKRDQLMMYRAIVAVVKNHVMPRGSFSHLIPSGTAIQNVRASNVGDTLTRDGFHLDLQLGRYIAGLTFFHALTKEKMDDITYRPDSDKIPEHYLPMIRHAVHRAVASPYKIADMSGFSDL